MIRDQKASKTGEKKRKRRNIFLFIGTIVVFEMNCSLRSYIDYKGEN
jgi:hypothetical protein